MTNKERRIQLDAANENLEKLDTELRALYNRAIQMKKNLDELAFDIYLKSGEIYKIQEQICRCKS